MRKRALTQKFYILSFYSKWLHPHFFYPKIWNLCLEHVYYVFNRHVCIVCTMYQSVLATFTWNFFFTRRQTRCIFNIEHLKGSGHFSVRNRHFNLALFNSDKHVNIILSVKPKNQICDSTKKACMYIIFLTVTQILLHGSSKIQVWNIEK